MCDWLDKKKKEKELKIALDCRNQEVNLFWQRSNFYWLFNAAALAALAAYLKVNNDTNDTNVNIDSIFNY